VDFPCKKELGAQKKAGEQANLLPCFFYLEGMGSMERLFAHRFYHRFEGVGVVHGQISQDFAVELYFFFRELMNQPGVRDTVGTGSGINPGDPKAAEGTLLGFAVAVSVLQAFFDGVFGNRVNIPARAKETFRELQDFLASLSGRDSIH
jgi:hypothetical protein